MGNIIAIVGRPNVGKSTLFNRLTESRQAIVEETSGVTRDRHYGRSDWNGIEFSVIDTGGYVNASDDVFEKEIQKQVTIAIEEADVILFLVDIRIGLSSMDEDVASILRRVKKPVFLIANKADQQAMYPESSEFYRLGLGKIHLISAINGTGTGDLLDEVVKHFKENDENQNSDLPKFAVIGRPNVGKSSLVNALLGKDRNIVTSVPGTTRDSIYTPYNAYGFKFLLVDTAGLRKKSKVRENIEFYSVMRSVRAIENSDVCILMIDATHGMEGQDINILHIVERNRKGLVVVVNKWDLIEKGANTHIEYADAIRAVTSPFTDFPIVFTSVNEKQRIHKTLDLANDVYKNMTRKIKTSVLNDAILPIISNNPPPAVKGKYIKIKYITQLNTRFPAFAFFCNFPNLVKESYKRFLENQIRINFQFSGTPVIIYIRKK